jgi:hypothetical protein
MSGYIGRNHRETLRMQAAQLRLPSIIADLEKLVAERRHDG